MIFLVGELIFFISQLKENADLIPLGSKSKKRIQKLIEVIPEITIMTKYLCFVTSKRTTKKRVCILNNILQPLASESKQQREPPSFENNVPIACDQLFW